MFQQWTDSLISVLCNSFLLILQLILIDLTCRTIECLRWSGFGSCGKYFLTEIFCVELSVSMIDSQHLNKRCCWEEENRSNVPSVANGSTSPWGFNSKEFFICLFSQYFVGMTYWIWFGFRNTNNIYSGSQICVGNGSIKQIFEQGIKNSIQNIILGCHFGNKIRR